MQQIEKVDNVNMVEKAFRRFIFKGFHMTLFRRLQRTAGVGSLPSDVTPTARSSELTEAPELQLTAHSARWGEAKSHQQSVSSSASRKRKLQIISCYKML